MESINIGNSGIESSRIGLGTWAIGGWMWGGTDEAQAIATIRTAIDREITLIDTAPAYGFGKSEEIVGKALETANLRSRVIIATKAGLDWNDGNPQRDSRPARLRQELEDSLRRLRTDYIDLYQIHWPDPLVPIEEVAAELARMRDEGKIRAIGVSNFSPRQMEVFRAVAPLHAVQPPYNLFERDIDADVLPYAARSGLTVLAYGALCRGLLSGSITRDTTFGGDDLRRTDPKFADAALRDRYLRAVAELDALAAERFDRTVLSLAVRWVLDRGPTIALWGARRPDQLQPISGALDWRLDEDAMEMIDDIIELKIDRPVGPEFMAPPARMAA
ncbi:MAG TPA: aldo/keto reductase [Steroidobacteraceae bacterium]|jgi:aryl-alcohol dehydrogenase-like predicted oxidoreductase|nr:aldo/keto reductase [Steroidobacteraceae bacterium]